MYRRELRLFHPFIVESGGAIFIPSDYYPFSFHYHKAVENLLAIELAIPYGRVRKSLASIEEQNHFPFRGFGDTTAIEVAEITGLDIESAELARQRG